MYEKPMILEIGRLVSIVFAFIDKLFQLALSL